MADLSRIVKYTNRDFNSLRNGLIDYSQTYFPDTFNDFSNSSTGMLFIEMASYVGDVLSFYLDNQVQETFIQYAQQDSNLYNLAYMLGYKPKVTSAASVEITVFQQVPAKTSGTSKVPDFDYALKVPANTQVTAESNSSLKFIIEDEIDFSVSSSQDPTIVSVYSLTGTEPNMWLLKKTRKAISATINTVPLVFGSPSRFATRTITAANIINVLDIVDTNGNTWYEVDNLAQDSVFNTITNNTANDPNAVNSDTPKILSMKRTQKRFTTRFLSPTVMQLEFGAGTVSDNDEDMIPNPDNVGTGLPFSKDKLTAAFSPLNFMFTDTYGVAPANTTLTVRYLTGGGLASNVNAGDLVNIDKNSIVFINPNLNGALAQTVFDSVAVTNDKAADGGSDGDTTDEIRQNALGNFQNQLRTVTEQDYLIRALSMPANLGTIAKACVKPSKVGEYETGTLPSLLDMYVLSYDNNKHLRSPSSTLKQNLKTYLSEYRMIGDAITIKDGYIINIAVQFDIIVLPNFNNNSVILACIEALKAHFNIDNWNIDTPIIIKDMFILLDKVEGVQTVQDVKITNKTGASLGYSDFAYDIDGATINDIVYPSLDPMVFELKYPNSDIIGRVVGF
tara:strand:+ start:3868 stop:5724 length:1857 start_codon:yes stop_codon:yes gene_type:complete